MECVLFIGLQGSGKSAYYKLHLADTHVRINRDMLKTKHREARLFEVCLDNGQRCVIDNTNATSDERARFIGPAKARGFKIVGYFFDVPVADAVARNRARPENQRVPAVAIYTTAKRLPPPTYAEGFDTIHHVILIEGTWSVT